MEDHGGRLELHDAPADFYEGRGALVRLVFPDAGVSVTEARPQTAADDAADIARPIAERTA